MRFVRSLWASDGVRQCSGAIGGMVVAGLLYLAMGEISLARLQGSIAPTPQTFEEIAARARELRSAVPTIDSKRNAS